MSFSCYICQSKEHHRRDRIRGVYERSGSIEVCHGCGHGFTLPIMSSEELAVFYRKLYGFDSHELIRREKVFRALCFLRDCPTRGKSILEVGPMFGYLLDELKHAGAGNIACIEASETVQAVLGKKGYSVFENFEQLPLAPWDVVLLQHSLEHFQDPRDALMQIRKRMGPHSRMLCFVPNFGSRSARFLKHTWGWFQIPAHRHHFTQKSLILLSKECGFEVIRIQTRGADSLMYLGTILNFFPGRRNTPPRALSALGQFLINVWSILLSPLYFICDEEIQIELKRVN